MAEPVLFPGPISNCASEHEYKVRITFGSSTASTIRAMGVTVERPTSTTIKLTFQKAYAEITSATQFWKRAVGSAPLTFQVTTDNLATTGDITLTCMATNTAGTATAPTAGDVAYLAFSLGADVLNDRFTSSTS